MKIKLIVSCLFWACLCYCVHAQKGYEVGGWLGTSFYYGDLNNRIGIQKPGPAGGFNFRRNFNTRVSFMGSLSYGLVGADDANSPNFFEKNRNLSFRSSIYDLSGVLEFNFFPFIHGDKIDHNTPYVFGGLSFVHFDPTAELNGQRYGLRSFGTEGQFPGNEYGTFTGSLIVGGGWKWALNDKYSINLHIRYHTTFTDYLDDVSGTYPDKSVLQDLRGPIAVALSDRSLVDGIGLPGRQRGNSKDTDSYIFFGVSLMRYIGFLECPAISDWR